MLEISAILENIGLTKSEIKVYLALLELGSSSTGPIVDKSKAASSKIYEVLEKLMQKGLVSFVIMGGVKHYEAASPKRLLDYLKEKQRTIQDQTTSVEALLPELEMKQTLSKHKSETLVFKGLKGAQTAFDNILQKCEKGEEFVAMGFSDVDQNFQNFLIRFHKRRSKQGIKFRAVFGPTLGEMVKVLDKLPHSKVKVLQEIGDAVATLVYKDTVLFSIPRDRLWIQVQNQDLANTMKERFEKFWNQKVQVFEGPEAIRELFWRTMDFGNYCAFGEGRNIVRVFGEEFFVKWQKEKKRRKLVSKIIMGSKHKNLSSVTKAYAQFKFIPGYENPGVTLIFKDKVVQTNFSGEPIAFLIEDKTVAASQQVYFDQMWNQDTTVAKGYEHMLATLDSFVDDIKEGDTFDVLGAAFGIEKKNEKYAKLFTTFHKRRQEKNVSARWLFQQGTQKIIEKNKLNYKKGTMKFLPYKNASPVNIYPYKDKTLIMLQGEEPTVITINNKEITTAFKKQFELQWNQDTINYDGVEGMEQAFFDALSNCNKGDDTYVYGASITSKEADELFFRYNKARAEKGVNLKIIFHEVAKKSKTTRSAIKKFNPLAEIRFTKDLVGPAVYEIFPDRVIISTVTRKNIRCTVINDLDLVESFKANFFNVWESAK